ncbi:MAG: hypothetical protein LBK47_02510 [Prevotellaceae bacterium]|jgi:hypothetical protein|nr:hypothetical protein [Prevotellaceae bacterium]
MEENEKIENPTVEYDMPSSYDDSPIAQPRSFKARYNAVWQQVLPQDKKRIVVIILIAMLVMLFLNIIEMVKIFKEL